MAAIDVQITARPTVEITHPNILVGGVVTEQINGVTIGTAESGTTNNQIIENSNGDAVGTSANPSVVGDVTVENSDASYSQSVKAEDTLVLSDTDIKANGDLVVSQPSTIEKDIVVRYETLGTVPTTIVSGEVVVPDAPTPTPPSWIGGKSISLDGVNDIMQGRFDHAEDLTTYGFGFVINDPTSTNGGVIGIAGFGYRPNTSNGRFAIDNWGRPNQADTFMSWENIFINIYSSGFAKDTPVFVYAQVSSGHYRLYYNGSLRYELTRSTQYPLYAMPVAIGYSMERNISLPRNCRIWTPLVTDGTLDSTEVAALSAAVLADTTPLISDKILEAWDFGTMATGVPSTSTVNPTAVYGMRNGSPIYCSPTFASPFGVVEDIT